MSLSKILMFRLPTRPNTTMGQALSNLPTLPKTPSRLAQRTGLSNLLMTSLSLTICFPCILMGFLSLAMSLLCFLMGLSTIVLSSLIVLTSLSSLLTSLVPGSTILTVFPTLPLNPIPALTLLLGSLPTLVIKCLLKTMNTSLRSTTPAGLLTGLPSHLFVILNHMVRALLGELSARLTSLPSLLLTSLQRRLTDLSPLTTGRPLTGGL